MMRTEHLKNAKKLLSTGNDSDVIYACLELRMAIEYHVYKKLEFYSKRYGTKLLFKKWQPNKAIKILCQLEPHADRSYTLSIGEEESPGEPAKKFNLIGRHEAISSSWINKNYNTLGSFLHLQIETRKADAACREYLDTVISELERVESGTLISNIAKTVSIDCNLCGEKITCCTSALSELEEVCCPNINCNATYIPENPDGGWCFTLNAVDFCCPECKAIKPILVSELTQGLRIKCNKCKTNYVVQGNQWQIAKIVS